MNNTNGRNSGYCERFQADSLYILGWCCTFVTVQALLKGDHYIAKVYIHIFNRYDQQWGRFHISQANVNDTLVQTDKFTLYITQ